MSAYPECKHGHNHPMHRCEQCDLENELDRLREENQQLREQAAAIAAAREVLERIAGDECYAAVPSAESYAERGRYTLPERTVWFRDQASKALALLNGRQP